MCTPEEIRLIRPAPNDRRRNPIMVGWSSSGWEPGARTPAFSCDDKLMEGAPSTQSSSPTTFSAGFLMCSGADAPEEVLLDRQIC